MAERMKMPRGERAKQFAPFDALKGLQDALRLKEYEHEKMTRGEQLPDRQEEISACLLELDAGDFVCAKFFSDGYEIEVKGPCKVNYIRRTLEIDGKTYSFDDLCDIKRLEIEN